MGGGAARRNALRHTHQGAAPGASSRPCKIYAAAAQPPQAWPLAWSFTLASRSALAASRLSIIHLLARGAGGALLVETAAGDDGAASMHSSKWHK